MSASAQLVNQVKEAQKMPGGRQAWVEFIEYKNGDKLDPAWRSDEDLQEFLAGWQSSGGGSYSNSKPQNSWNTWNSWNSWDDQWWGGGKQRGKGNESQYVAQSEEHAHLIARVKAIQRRPEGKDLWVTFVAATGVGKRDPAAHSTEALQQFLAESDPDSETVFVESNFDETAAMAHQIRKGQLFSDEFKQAWIEYTDDFGNGLRDPVRHPVEFLQAFLETAPAFQTYENDAQHAELVQQIKQGQRDSQEFKNAWWTYCYEHGNSKNDPARHDATFLSKFLECVNGGGKAMMPYNGNSGGKGAMKGGGKTARWSPY